VFLNTFTRRKALKRYNLDFSFHAIPKVPRSNRSSVQLITIIASRARSNSEPQYKGVESKVTLPQLIPPPVLTLSRVLAHLPLTSGIHHNYSPMRMTPLRKMLSFFKRHSRQPTALANTEPPPRGEPRIGMFNGADTVIINGGTFIFIVAGECFVSFQLKDYEHNIHVEPASRQQEHINAGGNPNEINYS